MTDCVLHIGVEKTGTTSIQETLAANREGLLSRGILYPNSLGKMNHVRTYAYASEGPQDEIKTQCGLDGPGSLEGFRRDLSSQFDDEVRRTKPKKIFISSELLSSRLTLGSEIFRLGTLLSRHCRSIKVVAYLRAPGDAHRSAYSTYVRTGGTDEFRTPVPRLLRDRYLYDIVLQRWENVFGPAAMDVRLYDPSEYPDGDIFLDFADLFDGLISISELSREPQKNISLDSFTLAFLRAINRYVPYKFGSQMSEMRGNLQDLVEKFASGPPFKGDTKVINAVNAAAEESNEAVRLRYFPGRPAPLFGQVAHDTTLSPSEPEIPDEAVRLMAFLWDAKQTQVLDLRRRLEQRGQAIGRRTEPTT